MGITLDRKTRDLQLQEPPWRFTRRRTIMDRREYLEMKSSNHSHFTKGKSGLP